MDAVGSCTSQSLSRHDSQRLDVVRVERQRREIGVGRRRRELRNPEIAGRAGQLPTLRADFRNTEGRPSMCTGAKTNTSDGPPTPAPSPPDARVDGGALLRGQTELREDRGGRTIGLRQRGGREREGHRGGGDEPRDRRVVHRRSVSVTQYHQPQSSHTQRSL